MVENNTKLQITGNSAIAATLGFNYYLKYFCNSSVTWAGKSINLEKGKPLPFVPEPIKISTRH